MSEDPVHEEHPSIPSATPHLNDTGNRKPRTGKAQQKCALDMEMLERLIVTGHTNEEICNILGISRSTWQRAKKLPEVVSLYGGGKEALIRILEDSLFRKAVGVQTVEKEYRLKKGETASGRLTELMVLEKETQKQLAPDTLALIFALKNLAPDTYKDRQEYHAETLVTFALKELPNRAAAEKAKAAIMARMAQLQAAGGKPALGPPAAAASPADLPAGPEQSRPAKSAAEEAEGQG